MLADLSEKAETAQKHKGGKRKNFLDYVRELGICFIHDWGVGGHLLYLVVPVGGVRSTWFREMVWLGQAHCMTGVAF